MRLGRFGGGHNEASVIDGSLQCVIYGAETISPRRSLPELCLRVRGCELVCKSTPLFSGGKPPGNFWAGHGRVSIPKDRRQGYRPALRLFLLLLILAASMPADLAVRRGGIHPLGQLVRRFQKVN